MNLWTAEAKERILEQLDDRNMPFKGYKLQRNPYGLRELGHGSSADVYYAEKRVASKKCTETFALKVIGFRDNSVDSTYFEESVPLQKKLARRNDNIVKIYDYAEVWVLVDEDDNVMAAQFERFDYESEYCIRLQFVLMELLEPVISKAKDGSYIITPQNLTNMPKTGVTEGIYRLAYDIASALKTLHDSNAIHRDIKLENVFYCRKTGHFKLGDFGASVKTDDGFASTMVFTKGYVAPEILTGADGARYDKTADIYSFGMMLYVLINGLRFPYSKTYSVNAEVQYKKGFEILPVEKRYRREFLIVVNKMCQYDPADRYQSVDDVIEALNEHVYGGVIPYELKHKKASLAAGILLTVAGGFTVWINGGYHWVAVWMITFAVVMFAQFAILVRENRKTLKACYNGMLIYVVPFVTYLVEAVVTGIMGFPLTRIVFPGVMNNGVYAAIYRFVTDNHLTAIGVLGMAVIVLWIMRAFFLSIIADDVNE